MITAAVLLVAVTGMPSPDPAVTASVRPPTVAAAEESVQVAWRGRGTRFRVAMRSPKGRWKVVRRTTAHRVTVSALSPHRRYRFRVAAFRGGWRPYSRPSAWVRPLAVDTGGPPGGGAAPPGQVPATPPGLIPPPSADAVQIFVDSARGSDAASGSIAEPLRTVSEAWNRVPAESTLARPHWIQIRAGDIPESDTPGYWEHRWGTAAAPVVINAYDGPHTTRFGGDMNVFDVRHLQVYGIDIVRHGDPFHCERCSHIDLVAMELDAKRDAQETIKANQSDHLRIAFSSIHSASQNSLDFVAVQHAEITDSVLSDSEDWCAYVKGGSAYVTFARNTVHTCGTGGISAGQGTGFEYMVPPWVRYEAYGVTVVDNVIHHTEGAGLGVNGSYNVRMVHNTLYQVGARSHMVEFVHGARSCDGNLAACAANQAAGGWGSPTAEGQWIPNRHVYFLNNVVYNPPGHASAWSHFTVAGPATPPAGLGIPDPSRADDDLRIEGNLVWNGPADMDPGVPDPDLLRAQNWVNTVEPSFGDPAAGDYRLVTGSPAAGLPVRPVPPLGWADSGVPAGQDPQIEVSQPVGAHR